MRITWRILGACWRGLLWVTVWPLGWYASAQARKRRRHNAVIRELRHRPCHGC